ncbi:MAG: acylphosphatase [Bacteroidetes bacterium]|nr:acylphosphatase [Bacteroidota bacterium]
MPARRYIVTGRVQGVGFRYFVKTIAEAFDISGSVSNRADGGVEIVAAGTPENLRAFKEQVELGPAGARVDRIETEHLPDERYRGFAIVRQ